MDGRIDEIRHLTNTTQLKRNNNNTHAHWESKAVNTCIDFCLLWAFLFHCDARYRVLQNDMILSLCDHAIVLSYCK